MGTGTLEERITASHQVRHIPTLKPTPTLHTRITRTDPTPPTPTVLTGTVKARVARTPTPMPEGQLRTPCQWRMDPRSIQGLQG